MLYGMGGLQTCIKADRHQTMILLLSLSLSLSVFYSILYTLHKDTYFFGSFLLESPFFLRDPALLGEARTGGEAVFVLVEEVDDREGEEFVEEDITSVDGSLDVSDAGGEGDEATAS